MSVEVLLLGGSEGARGGVERYCERFLEAFDRFPQQGAVSWHRTNTSVLRHGGTPLAGLKAFFAAHAALTRRLRSEGGEPEGVIWLQYSNALDLLTLLWVRWIARERPIVVTPHLGLQWRHLRARSGRWIARRVLQRANRIGAIADWQMRWLSGWSLEDVFRLPTLLPAWVNETATVPELGAASSRPKTILFVGRLAAEKGVLDLLRSVASLRAAGRSFHCRIVGAGTSAFEARVRRCVEDNQLADVVTLHGHLSENRVRELLGQADVFAHPSRADAFPLSLLEAASANLPIVAVDVPGVDEIVTEFGGRLVAADDGEAFTRALEAALDGRVEPSDGAACRAKHGWKRVVSEYWRFFCYRPAPERSAEPGRSR